MRKVYKFRLYPTEEQEVLLKQHFGTVRFVYNWALDYSNRKYRELKKHVNWIDICNSPDFFKLKEDNEWMYLVNSQSIQNSVKHLENAFQRFFKHISRFPNFKSKFDNHQSFEVPAGLKINFQAKKIQIPKFLKTKKKDNRIKFVLSRKVEKGKIKTATISRNPVGQYFVSFILETAEKQAKLVLKSEVKSETTLGIDFGLKHFLTLSSGEVIESPQYLKQALKCLRKKQRRFSRREKGSKNREKQRVIVARAHLQVANKREDFLHKVSTRLVEENQFNMICVEDLNLKGMQKLWGRKVSDLGFGMFKAMLEYKCLKRGKRFIKIGRFEPSSQLCSNCGHRQEMPLEIRTYECPICGMKMDRDLNAALNIRDIGLRDLKNTSGTLGIHACGVCSSGMYVKRTCETADMEARKVPWQSPRNGNHLH